MDGIIVDKTTRFRKLYYKFLFPVDEIIQWLSYGNENELEFREFAYTKDNGVFKRYISFSNRDEMVKTFYNEAPAKVDISAVYYTRPQYTKKINLKPVRKELIFDIDLTDYDELRICCSGTKICEKCWNYIAIACKILNASLREDWGFQYIFWVYSGRRGIHVWVCDKKVQSLNDNQRAGIADFFQLIKGSMFGKTRVRLNKMHTSTRRALKIIEPYFIPHIVVDQDMLGNKERIDKFLELLPTKTTKNEVDLLFSNYTTSIDRWQAFLHYIKTEMEAENKVWLAHPLIIQETILRYCYPRLDVSVTTGINHLLKLPFSVHPKTGKIAIILDFNKIDLFNPKTTPTVQSVWNEKIAFTSSNKIENKVSDGNIKDTKEYEKTSLKESVDVFKSFLTNLESSYSSSLEKINTKTESPFETKINICPLHY